MLSIGQFSTVCLVTIKTLRHYDKIGLMHPAYTDQFTGYRYYDEKQIPIMLLIQRLKRYGFSLMEIKELLLCEDAGVLYGRLNAQKQVITAKAREMDLVLQEMQQHLRNFERTGDIMAYQNNYTVEVKETQPISILSSRQVMGLEEFGKYYGKLFEQIAKENLIPGKTIAVYYDEEFNPESSDIEVAVQVKPEEKATRTIPGGLCAVTMHYGAYSSLSDAYGAVMQWIQQNGYAVAAAPYEIYLKTQFENLPPEQWETEIRFPIKKK